MFKDLRVLELASVLAGPSVGQFFAELGADVIKVENVITGGDVTRTWKGKSETTDDRSAYFCSVNWGKRSVALDLNTSKGREVVGKLIARSDVVIASYKPGDAEKLGVDYEAATKINPAIIYGQITGYGQDQDRVGYDAVIQAEAGFMHMNGEPGGKSLKMPVALMDILAAHQLKEGLLLALINRMKTGKGCFLDVSLIQSAVSSLVNQANNWLMGSGAPGKSGSSHPNIAPYGDSFLTNDGLEILLAVGNDKQFADLCRILQCQEVAQASHYINNAARVRNRESLRDLLQGRIATFDSSALIQALHNAKIPAGLIQNLEQVFTMDKAREILLYSDQVFGLRTFVAQGIPVDPSILPPPHFGEHTLSIVQSLD